MQADGTRGSASTQAEDTPVQPDPPRHTTTEPAQPDQEPNPGDPGPPLLKPDEGAQELPPIPGRDELPRGI
jgi:hypothetical protein